MAAERKGGVICLKCRKFLETRPWEPVEREVLENGWREISIKRKDSEEIFFLCEKCFSKIFAMIEKKRLDYIADNLSISAKKELLERGFGIFSVKAKNFERKFLLDSKGLMKFLSMIEG